MRRIEFFGVKKLLQLRIFRQGGLCVRGADYE